MAIELTAAHFVERLNARQSDDELRKIQRYFKSGEGDYGHGDVFMGVRMGDVFALAREFIDMAPDQIELLMESPVHEVRSGAMSIMGKQAARKRTTAERKHGLYELYLRRHDRVNNWDLVDLAASDVIGGYLMDKPRDVLYELARSAISGNAGRRSPQLLPFCTPVRQTRHSRSPRCCWATPRTLSTKRPAAGSGLQGILIGRGCSSSWSGTRRRCRARCCGTRWSTSSRSSASATWA